jgi:tetratricopeptide (TPR) repeat protein
MSTSMHMRGFLIVAAVVCLAGAPASADEGPQGGEDAARSHFQSAEAAYREGRYAEALRQFRAGYDLSPRPQFLLNIAQTYRKLGRFDEAIANCQRFLELAPESPLVPSTRELIARLQVERAAVAEHARVTAPETPPPPPQEAKPALVAAEAPPPRRSRAWIWGVTLGVVGVAAIAVGLGVGLTRDPVDPPASGGTLDFR